jgi:cytochrome c-type biogenesis protein
MQEYLQAFSLGNAAILGNVCLLPLYPGLLVVLANGGRGSRGAHAFKWLGLATFAGVVTAVVALGLLLYLLSVAFAEVLGWLLPAVYGVVLLLGVAMLLRRNPFTRLAGARVPFLASPTASAYVYGLLLGPMTLPCTGPIILSAFVIGGVSGGGALVDSLLYFLFLALGFGWPLVVLPFLALAVQHSLTGLLTRYHGTVTVLSGCLLVGIATAGLWRYGVSA